MGMLGEILLIPVVIVWMFWPLSLPVTAPHFIPEEEQSDEGGFGVLIIPGLVMSSVLFLWGRRVIRAAWSGQLLVDTDYRLFRN